MPSRPKTLLRVIPVPAIQGTQWPVGGNPQCALSGLSVSPFPLLVFDDDVGQSPQLGTNCNLLFTQNKIDAPVANYNFTIRGTTRDNTGAALGLVTVKLFTTVDDVLRYQTVSDASGNWSISVASNGWRMYSVEYLTGSPDRAGTSVNTLVGA